MEALKEKLEEIETGTSVESFQKSDRSTSKHRRKLTGVNPCSQEMKLANGNPEQQRAAAGELRLLAKRNADPGMYLW
ncbi:hypothetical protein JCGZ_11419 [Jatropha curcas]|uniref:Uncharacterized protein n=1 Tax=Jatropha curcas TaxID=180498 RepID=A0A067K7M6_JATCU|nr:hypothetical protein JCGZ_11419 [Jatropha curcas]